MQCYRKTCLLSLLQQTYKILLHTYFLHGSVKRFIQNLLIQNTAQNTVIINILMSIKTFIISYVSTSQNVTNFKINTQL